MCGDGGYLGWFGVVVVWFVYWFGVCCVFVGM